MTTSTNKTLLELAREALAVMEESLQRARRTMIDQERRASALRALVAAYEIDERDTAVEVSLDENTVALVLQPQSSAAEKAEDDAEAHDNLVHDTATDTTVNRDERTDATVDEIAKQIQQLQEKPSAVVVDTLGAGVQPRQGGRIGPGTATRPDMTNFEMVKKALEDVGAPMTAVEIRIWIVDNLWPACPAGFTGSLVALHNSGKLLKRGTKYHLRSMSPAGPVQKAAEAAHAIDERPETPKVFENHIQHKPPRPPPPKPTQFYTSDGKRAFEHKGKEVLLIVKWWRLVHKLYSAMGKGFLPPRACVEAAFGSERLPIDIAGWLKSERFGINEALEPTGLMMVIEQAGVFLRERD